MALAYSSSLQLTSRQAQRSRFRLLPTQWAFTAWAIWFAILCLLHPAGAPYWPWLPVNLALLLLVLPLGFHLRRRSLSPGREWGIYVYYFLQLFLVLPLVYEESGAFGQLLVHARPVEHWLASLDRTLFGLDWRHRLPPAPGFWNGFWQAIYLLNYLLLLLGVLLAVWPRSHRRPVQRVGKDELPWQEPQEERSGYELGCELQRAEVIAGSMISGLLLCYCFFPLLPAITPRLYYPQLRQIGDGWVHNLNWWLLARFSIPYGIFPSAHVAGPIALGCAFAWRRQAWAVWFLGAGGMIAAATVIGDFHFLADALAGVLAGVLAWAWVAWQLSPRRK